MPVPPLAVGAESATVRRTFTPMDPTTAVAEARYHVAYEEFAGPAYNQDLRGKGTLVIREPGPVFVFSGDKREALSFRRTIEIPLAPDQIWNVRVAGRRVEFATASGESGRRKSPFLFFCRTA